MAFVIAELKDGEQADVGKAFSPRGGGKKLWQCKDPEVMLSGPAETGKTWTSCQKLDALAWKYPGSQLAMVRKTQVSLNATVVRTYMRVIGQNSPVKAFGGSNPQWFDYPNGSRIWLGGMDNPNKVLSSERDFVYVNQAEELTVDDWEILRTRNTGRGGVAPYAQQFGDCNPGASTHWILSRKNEGNLTFFETRHEDNPTLFTGEGEITEQGRRSMAVLDSLTGVRYKRLRLGLWVSSEGQVFETYDPAVHLKSRDEVKVLDSWPRFWSIDFGYTNPFVWQEWVQDPDGRLYRNREIYHTQRTVSEHAKRIATLTANSPKPRAVICDHDAEDRATLEKDLGISTLPAYKSVTTGVQAVENRLKPAGDGKPRIFLIEGALDEIDGSLAEKHLPTCTEEEFGDYVWDRSNKRGIKEEPVKKNDHGMDDLRYMVAYADGLSELPKIAAARPVYAVVRSRN